MIDGIEKINVNHYNINETYYFRVQDKSEFYKNSSLLSESDYYNNLINYGNKRIFPYIQLIFMRIFDLNFHENI